MQKLQAIHIRSRINKTIQQSQRRGHDSKRCNVLSERQLQCLTGTAQCSGYGKEYLKQRVKQTRSYR
jgi:hypothetical protein